MRRLILDTAMALFVQKGYENVSIRGITDAIEYSPGTFYLYFKDKDEIFYQLHEEGFEQLLGRQRAMLSIEDPLERLRSLGEVYIQFALENPHYYELMFILKAPMRKIKTEWGCGMAAYNMLRDTVAACIEAGQLNITNVELATVAMWSQVHGFSSLFIRDRLQMIPDEQIPAIAEGIMGVLRSTLHPSE